MSNPATETIRVVRKTPLIAAIIAFVAVAIALVIESRKPGSVTGLWPFNKLREKLGHPPAQSGSTGGK